MISCLTPVTESPPLLREDECFWLACPDFSGGCRPVWALVRCYGLCPWGFMRLYLVQHGEAKSEAEDPERSLTIRGEEETRKISDAAKKAGHSSFKNLSQRDFQP